jgi:LysM repeat protein
MKKLSLLLIVAVISMALHAQPGSDVYTYINNYKDLAISEMHRTGVPASIKLAQGIHETFAGKSELVLKSNNHFGIKCKTTWTGKKVYHDDDARGECFRSYSAAADSYMDHSNFLRSGSRYSFLFDYDPTDYKAWAYGLKKAGYATNNKYSEILIRLIETYNLNNYTLIALNRIPAEGMLTGNVKPREESAVPSGEIIAVNNTIVTAVVSPVSYPQGQFHINDTRVIFAKQGTSLLALAQEYDISLARLLDFNDLHGEDVLINDQLVFLQRKRRTGINEFHTVQNGETLYDIAQAQGMRLKYLLEYNHLQHHSIPAVGERLFLHEKSPQRPRLQNEVIAAVHHSPAPADKQRIEGFRHVVQLKETLYSISKKYSVEIDNIREWNNLNGADLRIGQELVIYKN